MSDVGHFASFIKGIKMIEYITSVLDEYIKNSSVITANRLSIVNGKNDITEFGSVIEENKDLFLDKYANIENSNNNILEKCIIQIILAEIYYQKNDCYNSLVLVNSALAFMESEGNENIWIVGKFFQMCIMIVTGQVSAIYPLVDGMKARIYKTEKSELIRNYEVLRAWCALYDDAKDTIDYWLKTQAPNEYGEIRLEDSFAYMVKARVYYMQEKYMAAYTLLQSIINVLKENNRQMELCEVYMLLALTYNADGRKEDAYNSFEKSLSIATERNFIRLLADEGEAMYLLSKGYRRETGIKNQFLNKVIIASKEMALMYPQYLKKHNDDTPQLTNKEKEILILLADGRSNLEIAEFLDNSQNTIKHHIKNIFSKLDVNNRTDAVEVAKRDSII